MNLSRLILIFTILFGISSYGQTDTVNYPKVVVLDTDTVTIFTLEQSRELAKRNEQLKECDTLYSICESQLSEKDTVITTQQGKIKDLETAVGKYQDVVDNKDDLIGICEKEKLDLTDEVGRQKRHKWIAIISGGVVAILGILF
jgi:hypothetical protein